jgi:microcystin-dependent protein
MTANSVEPDLGRRIKALEDALYNLQRERTMPASTLDNCPTGMVAGFLSYNPPQGWLPLDGTVVTQAAYPKLYAWLVANGYSTTLPDYRNRFVVGAGDLYTHTSTGGSADAIVVSHTHTGPAHSHAQNVVADTGNGVGVRADYDADVTNGGAFPQGITTDSAGTGNTGSTGSSGTGANLPPYRGLYWMIRT